MSDVTLATSLAFAVAAGVATFVSPCAYPLLPGYVGFYLNQTDAGQASLGGAGIRGITAGIGVFTVLASLTGVTLLAGQSALSNTTPFESLVGGVLILFGLLVVTGYAPSLSVPLPKRRSSVLGFGLFGAGYALASAGCVAPIFLGVMARLASLPPEAAVLVLAAYAGTTAALIVSVTVTTGIGLISNASRVTAHSEAIERIAGGVMLLAGIGQLYLALVVY